MFNTAGSGARSLRAVSTGRNRWPAALTGNAGNAAFWVVVLENGGASINLRNSHRAHVHSMEALTALLRDEAEGAASDDASTNCCTSGKNEAARRCRFLRAPG